MDVLDIVKAKVPPDELPNEKLLDVYMSEVRHAILTYCNRNDIPSALNFILANMVVDLIHQESRKAEPDEQSTVKSIKEGDTSIEYGSVSKTTSEISTENVLYDYKSQLNRFRKLRW